MAAERNPIQVLKEAKQIALDHGCFVVEKTEAKGTRYLVYRKLPTRNVFCGQRFSVSKLRSLVCKVTGFK